MEHLKKGSPELHKSIAAQILLQVVMLIFLYVKVTFVGFKTFVHSASTYANISRRLLPISPVRHETLTNNAQGRHYCLFVLARAGFKFVFMKNDTALGAFAVSYILPRQVKAKKEQLL